MNIMITLSKNLLEKIISGEKKYEMRKSLPKGMRIGVDGFFVVEKGTNDIKCWCRVDRVERTFIDHYSADWFATRLCVPEKYVENYASPNRVLYLWEIGKVITYTNLKRKALFVHRNPQQFTYCPLSYGESY